MVEEECIFPDMGKSKIMEKVTDEGADELYNIMGLEGQKVSFNGIFLPVQIVSAGVLDILLAVQDERELTKIKPDFLALKNFSRRKRVVGVHAFTINEEKKITRTRNFAPLYGINEEGTNGTANAALTYYLYYYGLLELKQTNIIKQGKEMGRSSMIMTH